MVKYIGFMYTIGPTWYLLWSPINRMEVSAAGQKYLLPPPPLGYGVENKKHGIGNAFVKKVNTQHSISSLLVECVDTCNICTVQIYIYIHIYVIPGIKSRHV